MAMAPLLLILKKKIHPPYSYRVRTWSCHPNTKLISQSIMRLQRCVTWQWNGNFAGFLEIFLKNLKKYPMKWNLQFSGKWQN